MGNRSHWVKVSVVSGVLIAGILTFSHSGDEAAARTFKALVSRYSINRRQWVEIGTWYCDLQQADDKTVTKTFFHPTRDSNLCLDAREMSVYWTGEHELFAQACENWIDITLRQKGIVSGFLMNANRSSVPDPTEEERELINQAFHQWSKQFIQSEIQTNFMD